MAWTVVSLLVMALSATGILAGSGTYFVSSPQEITRGSVYSIAVDILNGSSVDVTALLQEKIYNGDTNRYDFNTLKNVSSTFTQGVRGHLDIPIEDEFKCKRCQLKVMGQGDRVFERSGPISVKSKVVSVFIQTDKAIYKPGQRVRYRAFAVYPDLKIYSGSFSVKIKDPEGHKIMVEKKQRKESGVIEGFLNLSDQPPFGDWSIQVTAEDMLDVATQYFTVAEYDLPRFEVTVDIPPFALLSDTVLQGTIKAKYTFGKPVKGLVDLYVGPGGVDSCGKMPKSVNVALEIDGEVRFSVTMSSIRRVMSVYPNTRVQVTAFVKESATGVRLSGSRAIQYYSEEFSISYMTNTPDIFKPGLSYTAYVQVKSPDGLPPPADAMNKITVYSYAEYQTRVSNQSKFGLDSFTGSYPLPKKTLEIPANGIVPLDMDIPSNATKIVLQAFFNNLSVRKEIRKGFSPSNNHLQLTLKESNIKSGETVTFHLKATEPLDLVFYEVVARGNIQKTGTLRGEMRSSFSFDLHATSSMAPVATLLTYYIRKDSEIIADSIAFNIDGVFDNEVSLEFSTKKAEPQNNIQLKVSADPKSQVFILAVDQSVLLLKSGNDIDIDKVEGGISDVIPLKSEFALSHSSSNVGQVFTKSGLRYFTDALMAEPVQRRYRPSHYGSRGYSGISNSPGVFDVDMGFASEDFPTVSSPGPAAESLKPVERIRKQFPEAWLWTDTLVLDDGTVSIDTVVPDTITTWVASAFATNEKSGLGVSSTKANMTVFRPFFVSLSYPRIVKRNEKAVIQATVFNYLPATQQVVVQLTNSDGFQELQILPDGTENVLETTYSQRIQVSSDSEATVYFPILAKEIGVFDIEVKAQSTMAADGVRRQIMIEPEGAPVSENVPIYVDQQDVSSTFSNAYIYNFPESAVSGSERISVGVSGDLIGPSLDNIDKLLSIPTGCGEQNLVKFAPNLYIGNYLQATGQLSEVRKQEVVDVLTSGYQRQLSYIRSDGSFSAFGNLDESGSTWLTAHVSRVLSEARKFVYVDTEVLSNSIDWLIARQRTDGSFVELGKVIDPNTQGEETGPALTAYCLLTLLQNKNLINEKKCKTMKVKQGCLKTDRWVNATRKAVENLERNYRSINDPFPLSVVTYALNVAKSSKAWKAFRKMRRKLTSEGGLMFFKDTTKPATTPAPIYPRIWHPRPTTYRPIDILSTSYALLAYAQRRQVKQAIPLVKWLVNKRNPLGGFSSTQDTTVALQALSAFASQSINPDTSLTLNFQGNGEESLTFTLDPSNLLNFQKQEFQNMAFQGDSHSFNIDASAVGKGFAVAEIVYDFHTKEVAPSAAFDVNTVLLDDDLDNFNLMICTKWIKEGKSGMVVQEIEIPSGFEPDLSTIGTIADMKRYERKGNVAAVYFDEIGKSSTCYSILMTRKSKVAQSEKTFVRTISYYQPEDKSIVFYQPVKLRDSTICDVCDKCCP